MSKTIKISLIVVAAIFTLVAVGIGYVSTLISPEKLTQLLISEVRDSTGRELKISGPVSLRFFPGIAVSAEQVSLSNAAWANQKDMARLEKIELDISLLPLLSRRIEVGSVALSGLDLYLETNSSGKGNWVMGSAESSTASNTTASASSDSTSVDGNAVLIENVDLKRSRIYYRASGAPERVYGIPALSLQKSGNQTLVGADLKQGDLNIVLKGKMSSIREVLSKMGKEPIDIRLDLEVALSGKPLQLAGTVALDPNKQSQFDFSLKANAFDLSAFTGKTTSAASAFHIISPSFANTKPARSAERLFSDTPLPLKLVPEANGKLDIQIGQLVLPNKVVLNQFVATARIDRQQLDVPNVGFGLGKGRFDGSIAVRNIKAELPAWVFKGQAKGFTLEQLLTSTNAKGKVTGGDMRTAFDLSSSGASPHQIASRLSGQSQITIGNARIASGFLNQGGDALITIFDAINPLSQKVSETVLECATAYLPVKNGTVTIANSIGIETDRLNITLAGSVNLNTELINVAIYPTEKSGLTLGVDLANLVRLQGTLTNPQVGINKEGVVNQALSIGLGFLTGGASILAQNAEGIVNKAHPCREAMRSWDSVYLGP